MSWSSGQDQNSKVWSVIIVADCFQHGWSVACEGVVQLSSCRGQYLSEENFDSSMTRATAHIPTCEWREAMMQDWVWSVSSVCHQKVESVRCLAGTADSVTDEPGDSGMQHPAIAPARVIRQRPPLPLPAHANHTGLCQHACRTRTFMHRRCMYTTAHMPRGISCRTNLRKACLPHTKKVY